VDLQAYGLTVHAFTLEDADVAADLRLLTRQAGLSFGDRACLALGRRLGLPVLTADRAWATLEVGVHIQLLR
jgi:ribonuclease VapC